MSLSKKIAAALDENTKVHAPPCEVAVEDGPSRLTLHLSALDSVGVAFPILEFATTSHREEWTTEALRGWGDRLAARVNYLMEPLKIFEVDTGSGEVQIRSQSPTPRAEQRGYYELRLFKQGTLRMERYAFDEATRQRRAVPCQLTREVLERLADDLAASVS
ncbi:MAG: hypothetical protein ACLQGP_20030 [Isosphaeraceae bacterium]